MSILSSEPCILIIEDDPIVSEIIAAYLCKHGMRSIEARDCASARTLAKQQPFDLALVDVNLPDGSGFDLVKDLRRQHDCGVIYITSLDGTEHRIHGLENGGDDYLVKPVDVRELLARVRSVLRRYQRTSSAAPRADLRVVEVAGWTIDLVRREIADPLAQIVPLTRAEFDLLAALAVADGMTLSRDYLIEVIGSVGSDTKSRSVDVIVSRIRRKLGAAAPPNPIIETCKGEGYRFAMPI